MDHQKHLKTPLCTYCKIIENIIHLLTECKKVKKIWTFFQKCYTKQNPTKYAPLQQKLKLSANNLPKNKQKLLLTLTITILSEIWKARNKLQFDNTNIPTNKIIKNKKQNIRNIMFTHYKYSKLNNTLEQFRRDFTIDEVYCRLIDEKIIMKIQIYRIQTHPTIYGEKDEDIM